MASTHTPALYNAALSGFLEGALSLAPSGAQNAALVTAAQAYATLVDATIPTDATLTTAANATTNLAATPANANALSSRPLALQGFCRSQIQAFGTDPTGADYTALATAVAATYAAYVAAMSLT
jgi:hypothetical protein